MPDVALEKADLRKRMRAVLRAVPVADRAAWSAAICERIATSREFVEAGVVCLFAPMAAAGEVDVWPLAEQARAAGKRLVVPRQWGGRQVELAEIREPGRDLVARGQGGGPLVPRAELGVAGVDDIDLILVPGLAYDEERRRLGRGGGVYDTLLRVVGPPGRGRRAASVAPAFEVQLVPIVPVEDHDQRVGAIVTERRTVR